MGLPDWLDNQQIKASLSYVWGSVNHRSRVLDSSITHTSGRLWERIAKGCLCFFSEQAPTDKETMDIETSTVTGLPEEDITTETIFNTSESNDVPTESLTEEPTATDFNEPTTDISQIVQEDSEQNKTVSFLLCRPNRFKPQKMSL